MVSFLFLFMLSCTPTALLDFAMPIWSQPNSAVEIDDAYKWLYQATRGGEHSVPDRTMAKKWLSDEWKKVGPPRPGESLWEPLCPDGSIGRLNIRPFRNRSGSQSALLSAFLESSRLYRGDNNDFLSAWTELGRRLEQKGSGKLNSRTWGDLDRKMRTANYPAVHHSKSYNEAKEPAYRIITLREMRSILHNNSE